MPDETPEVEDYEVADRGFYGKRIKTDYGDIVEVQQSSSAEKDAMWLRVRGEAQIDPGAKIKHHVGVDTIAASLSAHCDLSQALAIRSSIDWWLNQKEPSYTDMRALEEKIEPWVNFVVEHEGSEVGDMLRAYFGAVDAVSSGQEFGWAYQILTNLRDYFIRGIQDGWWDEMLEHFDEQYEYLLSTLRKKYSPEWLEQHYGKYPSEKAKELPELTS